VRRSITRTAEYHVSFAHLDVNVCLYSSPGAHCDTNPKQDVSSETSLPVRHSSQSFKSRSYCKNNMSFLSYSLLLQAANCGQHPCRGSHYVLCSVPMFAYRHTCTARFAQGIRQTGSTKLPIGCLDWYFSRARPGTPDVICNVAFNYTLRA
jgi:hypothetical protein